MKRGKKFLILLAVLAVLCGGALAAPLLTPDTQQEETAQPVTVFNAETGTLTQLSWTYNEETLTFGYKDGAWYYTEDPAFPVDGSILDTMAAVLTEVVAEKTVPMTETPEDFGLLRPVCSITVTVGDIKTQLHVGDSTAIDGLRYLSMDDGNVYLVDSSIYTSFQYGLYDLVSYETIPAMDTVTKLSVEAGEQNLQLQYLENSGLTYSDSYVWFVQNGEDLRTVDTELTETFLSGITGFTWDTCVDYYADEAELESYGLTQPAVTVAITYTQTVDSETQVNTFCLELGTQADNQRYARIAGSNMVYLIDAAIADSLLYTTYAELQPDEVLLMDWDTVESVTVTLDGNSYEFERSYQETTDTDGNTVKEAVYLLEGEETELQTVLDTLTALASTGYANGAQPERNAEIQFVFHRNTDTFSQVELTVYQYDSTGCLVLRDGTPTVFIAREDAVALKESVNALVLK